MQDKYNPPPNYPPPRQPREYYPKAQYPYPPQQPPPNYPIPSGQPIPPIAGPRISNQPLREQPAVQYQAREDARNRIVDKNGFVELKSNVLVITNFPIDQQQQKEFLTQHIGKYLFEAFLSVYKIEVVNITDRKMAEGIMAKFKQGFDGKENKEVYWGMEYWMKHSVFENEKGICKIPLKHIPPTILVNIDGSYEYIIGRDQRRGRDDYYHS